MMSFLDKEGKSVDKGLLKKIEFLQISQEAKDILDRIDKATHNSDCTKSSIPSLAVVSDAGSGLSSFSDVCSKILQANRFFPDTGNRNLIELVFPKDNSEHEKLFYSSVRRVASTTNRFYGVMCISFREFDGQDLIRSSSFENLLGFIEKNRKNIFFIFHVTGAFSMRPQLVKRLSEVINIKDVVIEKPTVESSLDYVLSHMEKRGYTISKDEKNELKGVLKLVCGLRTFSGYKSLNMLMDEIEYELNSGEERSMLDVIRNLKENHLNDETSFDHEIGKVGFRL